MLYATWSKPAPPSASGNATPVSPNSAAFLNRPRGKCPVSSSSLASGFTSDSANSRTLFCNSFCSSVSSRSTVAHSRLAKQLFEFCILGKRLQEAFVGGLQVFRVHTRLAGHGHEVRIPDPSRQHVQMQMPNHASARGAAQVHSQIHSIGFVICPQGRFHALRQSHHFVQRSHLAQIQFRNMRVRHDHHVPGGIGEAIQNDKCLLASMDDERLRVIFPRQCIAKNTFRRVSTRRLRPVLVAPRSQDMVHRIASFSRKSCAHSITQKGTASYTRAPIRPEPLYAC